LSINFPAATKDSLFARAIFLPHSIAFNVGFKPRKPTRAFTTVEVLLCSIDSNIASSPKDTLSWQTKGIS
jgi:hypothetical protein